MKQYKLYIFDFDGTLVDSYPTMLDIFGSAFKTIGQDCTSDQVMHYMRGSLIACISERGLNDSQTNLFVGAIMAGLANKEFNKKTKVYFDVVDVLNRLVEKGAKNAIVSGNNVSHIVEILKNNNMMDYFDCLVGSDTCKVPKPNPDPIYKVLDMFGNIDPKDVCYVGDSIHDYECALNAGIDGYLLDRNNEYANVNAPKISTLWDLLTL